MVRVRHISGRDLGELERNINEYLKRYEDLHYEVHHITFLTTGRDRSPCAFIEYETFGETGDIEREE